MRNTIIKISLAGVVFLVSFGQYAYSQGTWESGDGSNIGTIKKVGIGVYPPQAGAKLDITTILNATGSSYSVFAKNTSTTANLNAIFTARLNSCGDYSPQGQGNSVMGIVSGLTTLKANYSTVTARATGGYFSTTLSNPVMECNSGGKYDVAGCIAILTGTVTNYPANKVFAGLYAVDGIKSNLNTWAGYFDGNVCVLGTLRTTEVKVKVSPWADFVFEDNYKLSPLPEVEKYIRQNKHLPGIPKADEVKEEGINLGEMNVNLLQKVEELTLYIIEQDKRISELERKLMP